MQEQVSPTLEIDEVMRLKHSLEKNVSREAAESIIKEILSVIMPAVYELFGDKVVTKVKFFATERLAAVKALGFVLPKEGFKLQNEEECRDYYVAKLTEA